MTYDEKLIYYGSAKRVTAQKITQYIDGNFISKWAGRVRGVFVKEGDRFKFETKSEALEFAREWRDRAKKEAIEKGLIFDELRARGE